MSLYIEKVQCILTVARLDCTAGHCTLMCMAVTVTVTTALDLLDYCTALPGDFPVPIKDVHVQCAWTGEACFAGQCDCAAFNCVALDWVRLHVHTLVHSFPATCTYYRENGDCPVIKFVLHSQCGNLLLSFN